MGPGPRAVMTAGLLAALLAVPAARAQGSCPFIVEGTTWLWHADPPPAAWQDPATPDDPDTTDWLLGCAPFSNTGCGFAPGTYWPASTTLWLRQHVWLDGGQSGLVASVAIDNDFVLWVNGTQVLSFTHEGCATRWDAVVPIPDALWVTGDNVVALQIIDRGGVTNFEMRLDGTSSGPCPFGCATLPCESPGPTVTAPDLSGCAGGFVTLEAAADWPNACPTAFIYRFLASDGSVLRGWNPSPSAEVSTGEGVVSIEARCACSPTCPRGVGTAAVAELPEPPADPGPALRVTKASGLAVLSWLGAPPLLPDEHDHVWGAVRADGPFDRLNGEGETSRKWTDPWPGGRAYYLIRVADACEYESIDPR